MSVLESSEQIGFVRWFRQNFPQVLIFAIPNGGRRGWKTAKTLKAEGVVPGIPDLHIPEWNIWIEMKRSKGGVLSPDQKEIIEYLESFGDTVIVAHGAEEASKKILSYLVDIRVN
jgi:hypothetical protein